MFIRAERRRPSRSAFHFAPRRGWNRNRLTRCRSGVLLREYNGVIPVYSVNDEPAVVFNQAPHRRCAWATNHIETNRLWRFVHPAIFIRLSGHKNGIVVRSSYYADQSFNQGTGRSPRSVPSAAGFSCRRHAQRCHSCRVHCFGAANHAPA